MSDIGQMSDKGMEWLSNFLHSRYPKHLSPPYIYPTYEDNVVSLEWEVTGFEVDIELSLDSHIGEGRCYFKEGQKEWALDFTTNFDDKKELEKLYSLLGLLNV